MNKKAQVTIFVIVAILIVALAVLFFVYKEEITSSLLREKALDIESLPPQIQRVYFSVEDCIEISAHDVVNSVGKHGGYFLPSDPSTDSDVKYYLIGSKPYLPSKETIEDEISQYVNQELFLCTKDFADFPNLKIRQRNIETIAQIENDEIILNVNYPLSITQEDETFLLEEFENIKIPIRLGTAYNVAYKIIEEQIENPNKICLSCLIDLGIENDLLIDLLNYDEETTVFTIRDENSIINNRPYEFKFAIKNKQNE